jgi:hypothetical protein
VTFPLKNIIFGFANNVLNADEASGHGGAINHRFPHIDMADVGAFDYPIQPA